MPTTSSSWVAARPGWPPPSTPPARASTPSSSTPAHSGGQAGISDRIDNYPGFPDGISGAELTDRFVAQARRYGVELLSAVSVTAVEHDGDDLVTGCHRASSSPRTP